MTQGKAEGLTYVTVFIQFHHVHNSFQDNEGYDIKFLQRCAVKSMF